MEEEEKQQLEKIEKEADKEFEKTLKEIKDSPTTDKLEEIFNTIKNFTKMVVKGHKKGFLLYGNAGIGKTYNIIKAIKEENQKLNIFSGHITSLELYHYLYEHRKENVILDDINILENEQNLNLLKAVLGETSIVQYNTTSTKLKVPNKFKFEGSLIILLNSIPENSSSLKAVESRTLFYEMKLDYNEKIEILEELTKNPYKKLKDDERNEILKWIKDNTNEATENFSLRTLNTCYEFYLYDKKIWKDLALKVLIKNIDIQLIIKGMSEYAWCSETNKHRATYYRLKKDLPLPKCKCGKEREFNKEICSSCQDEIWKKEREESNKRYEADRKERERKQKAEFLIWKKQNEIELRETFEENKDEMEVDYEEYCKLSFQQNQYA